MSPDTSPDFDLGPLSWVQNEIDQAIARGLESVSYTHLTLPTNREV